MKMVGIPVSSFDFWAGKLVNMGFVLPLNFPDTTQIQSRESRANRNTHNEKENFDRTKERREGKEGRRRRG